MHLIWRSIKINKMLITEGSSRVPSVLRGSSDSALLCSALPLPSCLFSPAVQQVTGCCAHGNLGARDQDGRSLGIVRRDAADHGKRDRDADVLATAEWKPSISAP